MTSLRRALWALAAAGFVFGLAVVALIVTSDTPEYPAAWAAGGLAVGWSFIGVGLFAWGRRPDNRVGMLMTATGFAWLVAGCGLSDLPLVFTLGQGVGTLFFAVAVHLLLAFPSGQLESRADRCIVTGAYIVTAVAGLALWLFSDPRSLGCDDCPDNVLLVYDNETLVNAISTVINLIGAALITGVVVVLIRRWRRATPSQRRFLVPVYAAGIAVGIMLIATVALQVGGLDDPVLEAAWIAAMVPLGLVPYVFLGTLIRARMIQSRAVSELVARLSGTPRPGELRDALASALGDESLELAYWVPEQDRFVDAQGRPVELPEQGTGRAVTKVRREGSYVAAIVHDPVLDEQHGHVEAVCSAASLALENERLEAELRAKVEELRESRQRMLRVGLEERRRLERDLHDGAQQRLVSMALSMRLARARLRDQPEAAERLLDGASEELDAALDELRELARGIHPAVLSDRGLDTALEALAHRTPLPVDLESTPGRRLPEAVELAAYFVVSEALTNVVKYADATHATVNVASENGRVVVQVADDGVGGADPERGTGLRGLADRLAVLEGRLEIDSPPGRGTTVTARIPCG
ncbi:MAG: sensor histidine kinase [Thermoleophilaceae bacterium]|nr:sensor histidine kinase [Thermoleophilaceae bacterium]